MTGRWIHTPFAVSHDKIPVRMEVCREMYVEVLKQRMEHERHMAKLEQLTRNA